MVTGVAGRTGAPAARHVMMELEDESVCVTIRHSVTTGNLAQVVDTTTKCVSQKGAILVSVESFLLYT